jgi:hypothetical protein
MAASIWPCWALAPLARDADRVSNCARRLHRLRRRIGRHAELGPIDRQQILVHARGEQGLVAGLGDVRSGGAQTLGGIDRENADPKRHGADQRHQDQKFRLDAQVGQHVSLQVRIAVSGRKPRPGRSDPRDRRIVKTLRTKRYQ